MKTRTFTSTIEPDLIEWIDKRARAEKKTRRAVLEEAVRRYKHEATSKTLKEGFVRAACNLDVIELAEWGMDDYVEMTSRS